MANLVYRLDKAGGSAGMVRAYLTDGVDEVEVAALSERWARAGGMRPWRLALQEALAEMLRQIDGRRLCVHQFRAKEDKSDG